MKTRLHPSLLVLIAAWPALTGCSVLGLHSHVEKLEAHGTVVVLVNPVPKGETPTYALAWRRENGRAVVAPQEARWIFADQPHTETSEGV